MRKLLIILSICLAFSMKAQDAHFTQKFNNPLFVNPALTGSGEKINRLTFLYRDQWRSVVVPYSSTFLNYDRKLFSKNNNALAGGVQFFYDKAGDGSLSTFNPSLSFSYTRQFFKSRFALSTGVQVGYMRRSLDVRQLQFDNQYGPNGYDPNIVNGEALDNGNLVNLGLGVNLHTNLYALSNIDIGFSIYNPHQPDFSFSSFSEDPRPIRYNTYITGDLYLALNWSITPSFYFNTQEKAREFHYSLIANYHTHVKDTPLKVSLGGGYRTGDAALAYTGVKIKDVELGFSYDINTSGFTDATNNKGGFEISLQYEFEKRKQVLIDTIYVIDTLLVEKDTLIETEESDSAAADTIISIQPDTIIPELPEREVVPSIPEEFVQLKNSLPLQLFFDNDRPDPNTYNTTTKVDYITSYNQYLSRQQDYHNQVGSETAEKWFAQVTASKEQLDGAIEQIKSLVEKGYDVKLTLKGYTSPLAASQYNVMLSMRRIQSVLLYLKRADNGALQPYFEDGSIKVVENPFGESYSPYGISDQASDKKRSIYSPEASYERRVEVIAVEIME
ncbi:MAG: PorP/SprF family type IX secretion system membrane protein [Bacteroidetes bacterium]|nr:PorP/SprF family type IX secretion system membrane protein [Bacteroidota bacterium]